MFPKKLNKSEKEELCSLVVEWDLKSIFILQKLWSGIGIKEHISKVSGSILKRRLCLLARQAGVAWILWAKVRSWGAAPNQHHFAYLLEHPTNYSSQTITFCRSPTFLKLKFCNESSHRGGSNNFGCLICVKNIRIMNVSQARRRNMFLPARQKTHSAA